MTNFKIFLFSLGLLFFVAPTFGKEDLCAIRPDLCDEPYDPTPARSVRQAPKKRVVRKAASSSAKKTTTKSSKRCRKPEDSVVLMGHLPPCPTSSASTSARSPKQPAATPPPLPLDDFEDPPAREEKVRRDLKKEREEAQPKEEEVFADEPVRTIPKRPTSISFQTYMRHNSEELNGDIENYQQAFVERRIPGALPTNDPPASATGTTSVGSSNATATESNSSSDTPETLEGAGQREFQVDRPNN